MAATFANRSNARRAAKALGLDLDTLTFAQVDGGKWGWTVTPVAKRPLTYRLHFRKPIRPAAVCKGEDFGAHVTALWAHAAEQAANQAVTTVAPAKAPKAKGTAPKAPAARQQAVTPATNIPTHKEFSVYGSSALTAPVAYVHKWLDENGKGITRKEALYQLAQAGVNVFTARTQYQKWFTANKASL